MNTDQSLEHTLQSAIRFEGVGLHSGEMTRVTVHPAEAGQKLRFIRIDHDEPVEIPADVQYVKSTHRATVLARGDVQISTVEHLLSALYGCGIDNARIELDGEEVPILDGSAKPFVDAIEKVGRTVQQKKREYFSPDETLRVGGEGDSEILLVPGDDFALDVLLDFGDTQLSSQYFRFTSVMDYASEIAPARTFVRFGDIRRLWEQGLIRGGDIQSAVVLRDSSYSEEALRTLIRDMELSHRVEEVLEALEMPWRLSNEPARHKALDVLGDLALLGMRLKGRIIARNPHHALNVEWVRALKRKAIEYKKLKGMPKYDLAAAPLMDTEQIKQYLPHRYPFLLVDKIIELSDTHVVGIKNISYDQPFVMGHFPGNPVFPGVLQIEALAQTGGILAMNILGSPGQWDTYFVRIDDVRFKHMVRPGDTLILKMELLQPIKRGLAFMRGTAYVRNKIACEGTLAAQLIRKREEA